MEFKEITSGRVLVPASFDATGTDGIFTPDYVLYVLNKSKCERPTSDFYLPWALLQIQEENKERRFLFEYVKTRVKEQNFSSLSYYAAIAIAGSYPKKFLNGHFSDTVFFCTEWISSPRILRQRSRPAFQLCQNGTLRLRDEDVIVVCNGEVSLTD